MMRLGSVLMLGLLVALNASLAAAQEQVGDLDWRPQVAVPAYTADGPLIRVDQGHGSLQTIDGRYAGFAALMRADGYRVDAGRGRLDAPGALDGVAVLVIANAASPENGFRVSALTRPRSRPWRGGSHLAVPCCLPSITRRMERRPKRWALGSA